MTRIVPELIPELPWLLLCTCEEVSPDEPIMAADFRDTHALYISRISRYVGVTRDGTLLCGKEGAVLRDGIWYVEWDSESLSKYRDINLSGATKVRIK